MDFRHEMKHEISYADMLVIRQRMSAVAGQDIHAIDGKYLVRSLYFDNMDDKALREKIDGVNRREKFRIRYYNHDTSAIYLEKKSKINGLGNKQSTKISAAQVEMLLAGNIDFLLHSNNRLMKELYGKMKTQGIRPKIIVDYIREPFVYPAGNVRVTLDYDIRTGTNCLDFLKKDCLTLPATQAIVLEVKWDAFLPDIIRDTVNLQGRSSGAFSKYAACRLYG